MTSLAERANQTRRRLLDTALKREAIPRQELSLSQLSSIAEPASPVSQEVKWSPADQLLVDWFLSEKHLPADPFSFGQGVFVESPQKFYVSLKNDISAGAKGCRTIFGALQNDLQKLKNIVDQKC